MINANEAYNLAVKSRNRLENTKIEEAKKWLEEHSEIEYVVKQACKEGKYSVSFPIKNCPSPLYLKKVLISFGYQVITCDNNSLTITWV